MFSIVKAREGDLNELSVLAKQIWEEHFTSIIGSEQVSYMVDKFQSLPALTRQVREEGYTYYLLKEDEAVIGFMGVVFQQEQTLMSKLYIESSARGNGYASKALQFLMNECNQLNCNTIWLTCNKNNTNSIKAYEKMGFTIFDSVVNDIGQGYVMDDYYLKKVF